MKAKTDFVTNSSSCCYILSVNVRLVNSKNEERVIEICGVHDLTNLDMMKIVEGRIQSMVMDMGEITHEFDVFYNQTVEDFIGDGWGTTEGDSGDYEFAGPGWRWKGATSLASEALTHDRQLKFKDGSLIIPEEIWNEEKGYEHREDVQKEIDKEKSE